MFPTDRVMLVLLGIETGAPVSVKDDRPWLELPETAAGGVGFDADVLDELEGKGWVIIREAGPAATEAGRYWLAKWVGWKAAARCRAAGQPTSGRRWGGRVVGAG